MVARLGSGAFETISGEVVKAVLINLGKGNIEQGSGLLANQRGFGRQLRSVDVSDKKSAAEKAESLIDCEVKSAGQADQLGESGCAHLYQWE